MREQTVRGYIAIMTVLTLLVFSLSLLLTLPYLSLDGSKQSLTSFHGEMVLAALEGCAEDALLQSMRNENYVGGTGEYFGVHCEVSVEKEATLWRTLLVANKDDTIFRTLRIEFDRTPGNPGVLTLVRWLEE